MRASRRSTSRFANLLGRHARLVVLLSSSAWGCTLITDVDREKIPDPPQPTFPEVDAGPQPAPPLPDASVPDASTPGPVPADAGDAGGTPGADASDGGSDAAAPAADAG